MMEEEVLASRILIIDDQAANLRLLEDLFIGEGFTQLVGTTDAKAALGLYSAFDPDLVVLDLMMPELDGYAVLEQLKRRGNPYDFRPVLVITADVTAEAKRRALSLGAKDFLTKPFDTLEAMLRVWNLLETRVLYKRLQALSPQSELEPQSYRSRRN